MAESNNMLSLQDSELNSVRAEVAELRKKVSNLKSNLSIAETVVLEVEKRHSLKLAIVYSKVNANAQDDIELEAEEEIMLEDSISKVLDNFEVPHSM
ncbi:hypothetical protein F0562_003620 [Nyssa sinensis]|uniref:Uncharacterized protein n=1 Tax=Nyssa sinensis TaxID=561372 RepID=A0A5J5C172_9ASTE|nr:hypothetical protein F0562_003620 [Nyssa sinensis]